LDFAGANLHVTNNNASGNITLFTNFGGSGVVEVLKVLGGGTQGVFANGIISASGNVTGGNITTAGVLTVNSGSAATAIVNGAGNGVGNIGSATTYFNTIFAKATSAQYADLAEKYRSDDSYESGTVLQFGGAKEVTISMEANTNKIAGVVTTAPGFLMNDELNDENTVAVALQGRVPCKVIGKIAKGDMLVASAMPGVACAAEGEIKTGTVIGKSLEHYDSDQVGVIEIAIGR
jgi:hypothetical protein